MLRNFLFRVLITLYCIIGMPIWILSVAFYWAFSIVMFIVLAPLAWLFFGSVGFEMICTALDLDTYRKFVGLPREDDAHITPLWFFMVFDIISTKYKHCRCEKFK